jgi:hypothetical protein
VFVLAALCAAVLLAAGASWAADDEDYDQMDPEEEARVLQMYAAYEAGQMQERRDFEVKDPEGLFKDACAKYVQDFGLSGKRYFVHSVEDKNTNGRYIFVMMEEEPDIGRYCTVAYKITDSGMKTVIVGREIFTPPLDDYLNMKLSELADGEGEDVFEDIDYESGADATELTWESFIHSHKTFSSAGKKMPLELEELGNIVTIFEESLSEEDITLATKLFTDYVKASYFANYPEDDGYEPVGVALEKYFSKTKWELAPIYANPYPYDSSTVPVLKFTGITKIDGMNAKVALFFVTTGSREVPVSWRLLNEYSVNDKTRTGIGDLLAAIYIELVLQKRA